VEWELKNKVLLIVIDQFRADCLQGALSEQLTLPHLQALKAESTCFSRHYTVTSPCGPSRASLLTGLYAMNHRSIRNGSPLPRQHPTMASEFRKAGYEPMLFGYTDVSADPHFLHPNDPDLKSYEGLAPGFSEVVRLRLDSNTSWIGNLKTKGYELPEAYWDLFRAVSEDGSTTPAISDPALYKAEDSDTAFLTDRTLEELCARDQEQWFSLVTYIRPHPPLVAPAPYNKMIAPSAMSSPIRPMRLQDHKETHPFFAANYVEPSNHHLFIGFDGNQELMTDEDIAELRAVYAGLAMEVDHHIGRLISFLKESGQYDDTLIVVTADHGEMLGDHYMWGKEAPYEAALHVPLIIRDPRNSKGHGSTIEHFTETIDVTPTLLDWIGEEPNISFNGQSLLPFLKGERPETWRDYVFSEVDFGDALTPTRFQEELGLSQFQSNFAVIRDAQFKYVHFNGGLPPLLYDMKADPHELTNLAADPAHTSDLLHYANLMLDHRMSFAHHATSRMSITPTGIQSR
jgi:arylsulfatase A-like enzyme